MMSLFQSQFGSYLIVLFVSLEVQAKVVILLITSWILRISSAVQVAIIFPTFYLVHCHSNYCVVAALFIQSMVYQEPFHIHRHQIIASVLAKRVYHIFIVIL